MKRLPWVALCGLAACAGTISDNGDAAPADAPASPDAPAAADAPAGLDAPAARDAGAADAAATDGGECATVAEPAPISDLAIPGQSPAGAHSTTTVNGFQDDYLSDATSYLKIGVRREWGGSVVFFGMVGSYGPGLNPTNAIDANDTGREVQVAFYDPDRAAQNCAWNASCASTPSSCAGGITYLGWDPVQGGNRCNVGSGVESVTFADGALRVQTVPRFWNPTWDRQDCETAIGCSDASLRSRASDVRVIQTLRFVRTHIVQLDYTVVNLSPVAHRATAQEMPTVYTANGNGGPDLWRLLDSSGTQIAIDTPAGGDGFYYKNFTSPGGWAAMQNDDSTYGVGIYYENRLSSFQAWQLRSLPFNNVRALFSFGIPASGTVRARAYLILGGFGTIASEVAWLDGKLAPFGVMDEPAADAVISGVAQVRGWALDNHGVTGLELLVDGVVRGTLTYGAARPDVCLVWPGYAGCDAVGYSGTLDTSALTACAHLLEVRASDADGNARVIAARRVTVTR